MTVVTVVVTAVINAALSAACFFSRSAKRVSIDSESFDVDFSSLDNLSMRVGSVVGGDFLDDGDTDAIGGFFGGDAFLDGEGCIKWLRYVSGAESAAP